MAGLMSEKYLGVPAPSTTGASDPDLDDVAAAMDLVNNYGGWEKLQVGEVRGRNVNEEGS
jgi:hypothetical protein